MVIINVASSHLNGTSNYNTSKNFYLRKNIDLKTVKKLSNEYLNI